MSTGEGIVASTALLIATFFIWQITLHQKWKIVGKWVAITTATGLLVGTGLWQWKSRYGHVQASAISQLPEAQTELGDIRLNSTQLDLKLKKGKPNQISESTENDGRAAWKYSSRFRDDPELTVIFDKDNEAKNQSLVAIICAEGGALSLLGIKEFANEASIRTKLGDPTDISIRIDGLAKMISYKQWNAAFQLEEDSVRAVCISNSGKVRFGEEYKPNQK
jgi:hypothetical protein